jgi:hypothetical protein
MRSRMVLWVAAALIATVQVVFPGVALACVPLGGDSGKGADGGDLMSDGANVALYEWSATHNALLLVDRWADPSASSAPPEPDEVDVTHEFFPDMLSCGWNPPDPGRPPVTLPMVPALPGPAWGGFLLVRSSQNGSGAPVARARWRGRVQVAPEQIPVPDRDCDNQRSDMELCNIVQVWEGRNGPPADGILVPNGWVYFLNFRDGRFMEVRGTGLSHCVSVHQTCTDIP